MDFIASTENIEKIVRGLTDDIGVRLAGSEQEMQASKYLASEMKKYTPKVSIEEFPCNERMVTEEHLELLENGQWREYPCSLFSSAPGTKGKTLEAELVFFDKDTGYQREDLSFMTGKALVHLGCHIENEDDYRRLMEARPAFILFIDARYPADKHLNDGLFPAYVAKYGAVPCMNVAYQHAWKWHQEGTLKARLRVEAETHPSMTSVVIAELPGSSPDAGFIYAGGHHDTQAGTVGADDNAIGSAAVVELARLLSTTKHRRGYRLCSFGAEEQLSLGSASYVRRHREELAKNGLFMCNFDSFGSALGWDNFTLNATEDVHRLIKKCFNSKDIYYNVSNAPCPYTDQFPFAAAGVPGIWISRVNCTAGLFYHHRIDNTPDKIDFTMSAKHVEASAMLLDALANAPDFSVYAGIPAAEKPGIANLFNQVYGGF